MIWALHLANVIVLCSFLVRDIVLLRLLSILAGIFFSFYFLSQDPPTTDAVMWNCLFAVVNIVQIFRQWFANRKIPLEPDEVYLKENLFPSLRALEIRELFQNANRETVQEGRALCNAPHELRILLDGNLSLNNNLLGAGDFIGVQSYLNDEGEEQQGTAASNVCCLC